MATLRGDAPAQLSSTHDRYGNPPRSSQQLVGTRGSYRSSSSSSHHDDSSFPASSSAYHQSMLHHPHQHPPPSSLYSHPQYSHQSHHATLQEQQPPLSIVPLHHQQQQRWTQPPPPTQRPNTRQQQQYLTTRNRLTGESVPSSDSQQQQQSVNRSTSSGVASSRTRDVASAKISSSGSSGVKKTSPTVTKLAPSPRISKPVVDNSQLPAMLPLPSPPADHDHDAMMTGLKLQQQEWLEKSELKRMISETARLVVFLQATSNSVPTGVASDSHLVIGMDPQAGMLDLVVAIVKEHIELLKLRVLSKIQSIKTMTKDIEGLELELTDRDNELRELREGQLETVTKKLYRAKRKRRFHSEFERVAEECLAKKPRHVYAEEQAKEQEKLREVQKATGLWKQVGDVRSRQIDITLCHLRELLESLKNPETVIELLQQANEGEAALPLTG